MIAPIADNQRPLSSIGFIEAFVLSGSFLLMSTAIALEWHEGVPGYEVSPFLSRNPMVLILYAAAFAAVVTTFMLTRKATIGAPNRGRSAFYLAFMTLFGIVISLEWAIRYGVPKGIGDTWIHLAFAKDILASGHVDLHTNMYPGMHVLHSATGILANIDQMSMITWSVAVPSMLPILTYLIVKRMQEDEQIALMAGFIAVAGPLVTTSLGQIPVPYTFSFLMLLLAYTQLFCRRSSNGLRTVLILTFSFAMIIYHSMTAIFFVSFLLFLYLFVRKPSRIGRTSDLESILQKASRRIVYTAMLVFSATISWLVYVSEYGARNIALLLSSAEGALYDSAWSSQTSVSVHSLEHLIILRIGVVSYLAIAVVSIAVNWKRGEASRFAGPRFVLLYLVFCAVWYFSVQYLLSRSAGVQMRYLYFGLALVPLPMAILFWEPSAILPRRLNWKRVKSAAFVGSTSVILALSIVVMFPSPEFDDYNRQTSIQQLEALDWFFSSVDSTNSSAMGLGDHLESLARALYFPSDRLVVASATNGMILLMGLDPSNYTCRGMYASYDASKPFQYVIYQPMIEHFLAYEKFRSGRLIVTIGWLLSLDSLSPVYSNGEVIIFQSD